MGKREEERSLLTVGDAEVLKERIGNMTPEEKRIVATKIDTSIILEELILRLPAMCNSICLAANDLRSVQKEWLK